MSDNNVWEKLAAVKLRADSTRSHHSMDKKYAENINQGKVNGDLTDFYEAVEALELGCGFWPPEEIYNICHVALSEDPRRFALFVERQEEMFMVFALLSCVDITTKVNFIKQEYINNPIVLFEILRQILNGSDSFDDASAETIDNGLIKLSREANFYFKKILQRHVLFRNKCAPIFTNLIPLLSANGWRLLGECFAFKSVDSAHMSFIDKCVKQQNWASLYDSAYSFVEVWYSYLEHCIDTEEFGSSLYHNASNLVICILVNKLSYDDFINALGKCTDSCQKAMNKWYTSETSMRSVLYAHLSFIEHMHFVWENKFKNTAPLFPEVLQAKIQAILNHERFLWDNARYNNTLKTVQALYSWVISF